MFGLSFYQTGAPQPECTLNTCWFYFSGQLSTWILTCLWAVSTKVFLNQKYWIYQIWKKYSDIIYLFEMIAWLWQKSTILCWTIYIFSPKKCRSSFPEFYMKHFTYINCIWVIEVSFTKSFPGGVWVVATHWLCCHCRGKRNQWPSHVSEYMHLESHLHLLGLQLYGCSNTCREQSRWSREDFQGTEMDWCTMTSQQCETLRSILTVRL